MNFWDKHADFHDFGRERLHGEPRLFEQLGPNAAPVSGLIRTIVTFFFFSDMSFATSISGSNDADVIRTSSCHVFWADQQSMAWIFFYAKSCLVKQSRGCDIRIALKVPRAIHGVHALPSSKKEHVVKLRTHGSTQGNIPHCRWNYTQLCPVCIVGVTPQTGWGQEASRLLDFGLPPWTPTVLHLAPT